jgi:hypothetical protein
MKKPLPIWHIARAAAIARHRWLWMMFERSDPAKWAVHMQMIDAVFGVEEV